MREKKIKAVSWKRYFAILLSLVMAVSCLQCNELAFVHAEEAVPVLKVNGIDMLTSTEPVTIGGGTAAYDAGSNTLSISGITTNVYNEPAILCENMDLAIQVSGENTLEVDGITEENWGKYNASSLRILSGNVTMQGSGVINAPKGIGVTGSLSVTDTEITAVLEYYNFDKAAVDVRGSMRLLGNAKLRAQGGKGKTMYGSAVYFDGGQDESVIGTFELAGNAVVELTCGDPESDVEHGYGICTNRNAELYLSGNASLSISGENCSAIAVGKLFLDDSAKINASIKADKNGGTDYAMAITFWKALELNGESELTCDSDFVTLYDYWNMNDADSVEVNLNGSSKLTLEGKSNVCAYGPKMSFHVNENASLSVKAPGNAVRVNNFTINDSGNVTIVNTQGAEEDEVHALRAMDTLTINGGTLNVSATNHKGQVAGMNNVTITGGNVKAGTLETGEEGNITVSGAESFEVDEFVSQKPLTFYVTAAKEFKDFITLEKTVYQVGETVTFSIENYLVEKILVNGQEITGNSFAMPGKPAVITLEGKPFDADYTIVDQAIASVPKDLSKYTKQTAEMVNQAVEAVVRGLDIRHQQEVDAMAQVIQAAVQKLALRADYSKVEEAVASVPKDLTKYTEETVRAVNEALEAVVEEYDITHQEEVNAMAEAIETAVKNLTYKPADYSKVEEAIASAPKDLTKYTEETVTALNKALEAVEQNLDITHQEEVNAMAEAIETAVKNLTYKPADYSKVEEAVASVPKDLTKYTEETVRAVNEALEAVVEEYDITHQEEVNAMAEAIETAVKNLTYKPADYSKVEEAIASAPKDLTKYTEETVTALNKALEAVEQNLDITHQEEVNAMAEAIETAVKNLVLKAVEEPQPPTVTSLAAPKSVKARSVAYNKIKISWKKVTNASGYEIFQYNSKTKKYKKIGSTTKISYTKKGLKTGTVYKFKVRAYRKESGQTVRGKFSSVVSAKPALSKVAGFKKGKIKKKSISMSWKKVSGANGYRVFRAASKKGKYKVIKTITKGKIVKFTDKRVKSRKNYYYKIRAYRKVGKKKVYGGYSKIIKFRAK